MPVPLDQFAAWLTASKLLPPEDIRRELNAPPPPADGETFAQRLVERGLLTAYQAKQIAAGKPRHLVLGNYIVLEKIGQGGQGSVFKARHKLMDRLVAIKVLSKAVTSNPNELKRFQREVLAAGRLNHPNIVAAFDADNSDGVHFLVMEYVEGQDLASLVKKHGPLNPSDAIQFILQVAEGLDYAHSQKIIHRDIKPSNLLVDKQGMMKILDLGLARRNESEQSRSDSDGLTNTGQVLGTVDYMAPEQAANTKTADHRADIYSLGCTLYRLLVGKMPYGGDTVVEKILAHREEPIPSLDAMRKDLPRGLDHVFATMVAKRPDDRYQSMQEVMNDLEACLAGESNRIRGSAKAAAKSPAAKTGRGIDPALLDFLGRSEPGGGSGIDGSGGTLRQGTSATGFPQDDDADPESAVGPPVLLTPAGQSTGISLPPLPTMVDPPPVSFYSQTEQPRVSPWVWAVAGMGTGGALLLVLALVMLSLRGPGASAAELKGTLKLEITEPGAIVVIDHGAVRLTSPPSRVPLEVELAYGEHEVQVTKDGFDPTIERVNLNGPSKSLRIRLSKSYDLVWDRPELLMPAPSPESILNRPVDRSMAGLKELMRSNRLGELRQRVQNLAPKFPELKAGLEPGPQPFTRFSLNAGGQGFDAIRFKTPPGATDLVWAFSLPEDVQFAWSIMAVEGTALGGFKRFSPVRLPDGKVMILQKLASDRLAPNSEFVLYFSFDSTQPVELSVSLKCLPADSVPDEGPAIGRALGIGLR